MPATIQTSQKPTKARALDTSTSEQIVGPQMLEDPSFDVDVAQPAGDGLTVSGPHWMVTDADIEITGGKAVWTSYGGSNTRKLQDNSTGPFTDVTARWRVEIVVSDYTSGELKFTTGSYDSGYVINSAKTWTFDISPETGGGNFHIFASTDAVIKVSEVSIYKLESFSNNNHGQIYSGRALEFDGLSDYLSMHTDGLDNLLGSWPKTFACWFYADVSTSEGVIASGILSDWGIVSDDAFISTASTGNTDNVQTPAVIESKTWYRLVVVSNVDQTDASAITAAYADTSAGYGPSNFSIYLNGERQILEASSKYRTSNRATIGARYYSSNYEYIYSGKLSDVQVWDTAFTAEDALYDYNNPEQLALNRGGTSLTNSNLKLWYPMNDGHRGEQSYILDASNTGLGDELVTTTDLTTVGDTAMAAGDTLNGWTHHATYQFDSVTASSDGIRIVSNGVNDLGSGFQAVHTNPFLMKEGVTYRLEYSFVVHSGSFALNVMNNPVGSNVGISRSGITGTENNTVKYFTASSNADASCYVEFYSSSTNACDATISYVSLKPVNDKNHATTAFYGDELVLGDDKDMDTVGNWVGAGGGSVTGGYDSGDAGHDKTLRIEAGSVDHDRAELPQSDLDTVLIAGRTYLVTFDYKFINNTNMVNDAYITIGDTVKQNIVRTNTSWTAYSDTFVASDSSTNIRIYCQGQSGHADNEMLLDNFSIKEQGTASGWTDADQQLDIPQTALQSYNQLLHWHGEDDNPDIAAVISDDSDLDIGTDDFTLSAWFKREKYTDEYMSLISKGGAGGPGYSFGINSANKLAANTSTTGNNIWSYHESSTLVENGKWYHYVSSHDRSGNCTLYLNGKALTTTTASIVAANGSLNNSSKVRIGQYNPSYWQWNGCITECSIWKGVAMNDAQVKELYNDGLALDARTHSLSPDSGPDYLAGYWRNNGLAQWKDLSGNDNHSSDVNGSATMLITAGADSSRDSQGFPMNRKRTTNSLNLENDMGDNIDDTGSYMNTLQSPLTTDTDYDAMTVTLWFKLPDKTAFDNLIQIVHDNGTHFSVAVHGTGRLYWTYEGSDMTGIIDARYKTGVNTYSSDKWTFVAFALQNDIGTDANRVKCYVGDEDNVVSLRSTDGIHSSVTTTPDNDNKVSIARFTPNTKNFTGQVDDVCVYNRILELPEITRNYNAGKRSHR